MLVDGQKGLFEEDDPLALFILRLVEDGLHFLHVAGSVAVDLLQDLLIAAANLGATSRVQTRGTAVWVEFLQQYHLLPAVGSVHFCFLQCKHAAGHLLSLLLDQRPLLVDLLLLVDGDVRVSLSVKVPLSGRLLLPAHLVVGASGLVQLRTEGDIRLMLSSQRPRSRRRTESRRQKHLLKPLGPGLLSAHEARLDVLGLLKASKQLLVEGVLLPGPDPVSVLRHQQAADGGVQRGQPVGGGHETLPGLHERPVQRTCGQEENVIASHAHKWPLGPQLFLLESTTGFHLVLHSLSCWAYCLSTRARSWKQATMSLQAWKASSVRFTVL